MTVLMLFRLRKWDLLILIFFVFFIEKKFEIDKRFDMPKEQLRINIQALKQIGILYLVGFLEMH